MLLIFLTYYIVVKFKHSVQFNSSFSHLLSLQLFRHKWRGQWRTHLIYHFLNLFLSNLPNLTWKSQWVFLIFLNLFYKFFLLQHIYRLLTLKTLFWDIDQHIFQEFTNNISKRKDIKTCFHILYFYQYNYLPIPYFYH